MSATSRDVHERGDEAPAWMGPGSALDALRLLSISHTTAPLDQLERMALTPAAVETHLRRFHRHGIHAVLLSTCNRVELYWASRGADEDAGIESAVFEWCGRGPGLERHHMVARSGRAAARHLFRVTAGLDSLVVGEAEILGQVRDAIETAERHGTAGPFVSELFHAALRFGARVRRETGIGTGALSVASAAARTLAEVHPDLPRRTVFVVGAGVTGRQAARHLRAEGVGRLVVFNRTAERAGEAARELGCEWAGLDALHARLHEADAIVAAAQVETPLLTADALAAARDGDVTRPLVLLDLSLPRSLDPACGELPGVAHFDLSRFEAVVAENRAHRENEIPRVEELLERELAEFETHARELAVRPLLAELHRHAEAIRRREVEEALAQSDEPVDVLVERVTRRIVDRLLHAPSMALRRGAVAADAEQARAIRAMFGLDGEPARHVPEAPNGANGAGHGRETHDRPDAGGGS